MKREEGERGERETGERRVTTIGEVMGMEKDGWGKGGRRKKRKMKGTNALSVPISPLFLLCDSSLRKGDGTSAVMNTAD